ncbi:MAG: hypothetical protein PHW75_02265 [Patescibacteria group bacterium]|nr:hypothetical protein [Patescibacteria group bacterium]
MKANPTSIVTGMFILLIVSYLLVMLYTYLYTKYLRTKKIKRKRFFLSIGIVSLAWVAATLISVMFAGGAGMLIFAGTSFVLLFGANYFISERMLGLSGKHKVLYSLILAAIINPTWYFILV